MPHGIPRDVISASESGAAAADRRSGGRGSALQLWLVSRGPVGSGPSRLLRWYTPVPSVLRFEHSGVVHTSFRYEYLPSPVDFFETDQDGFRQHYNPQPKSPRRPTEPTTHPSTPPAPPQTPLGPSVPFRAPW